MTGSSRLAPIVLFVYNRPLTTKRVLDALAANEGAAESILYIYCDGAKQGASAELTDRINQTRSIAHRESRFKNVFVIEQPVNKGLSNSIISAISEICTKFESIIVLEDDIVTSPFFLRYMNEALVFYKNTTEVASISGYWYPTGKKLTETFFLKNGSCWGWATWRRAWNDFETDGKKLLAQLQQKKLTKSFDLEGSIKYTRMLQDQIERKNDSWAIRWDAVNFLQNKLCLYPSNSLVQNIGFDGMGTHSGEVTYYNVSLSLKPVAVNKIPLVEDDIARYALKQFYKRLNKDVFKKRVGKLFSISQLLKKIKS